MGHTHRYRLAFKKKIQVKSPSPESRVPETGSDPPIGSDRESGRDKGCEISVHGDQMDPLPEEQQSQQGTPMNPTTYRSMRDHIHPPRVSTPSCIIPPVEDVAVRPYLVPLLPTFHGMENENPYTHIGDFEEVCLTFKEGKIDMDLLKLKAFPLTLKDKAKIWLNSLRPRTIRNWAEL